MTHPFSHAALDQILPPDIADALVSLPFEAPKLEGGSGTRELHNLSRRYFDAVNMARFPVVHALAHALQSTAVVQGFAEAFGASLEATYLRLEYAQDVDGFWLEPHTDLGVKKFTCIIYLSRGESHADLGTDLYEDARRHWGRSSFVHNSALVFVPGSNTWHGFERRPIEGVRRSVILNYVSAEWRAREQLSFPDEIIRL